MSPFVTKILQETGYLDGDGLPADGLIFPGSNQLSASDGARVAPLLSKERSALAADAVFKVGSSPVIIFKSSDAPASDEAEAEWHRLAWNFGVAPLLWVTTPQYVRIYNAYQPPESYSKESPLLGEFAIDAGVEKVFGELARVCGRRHVAMGGFWRSAFARKIDRRARIDNVLLRELTALLKALVGKGVRPPLAQKLVGRCIFFQYLAHRGYVADSELLTRFGGAGLSAILTDLDLTYTLFRWIRETFNGDLFPIEKESEERDQLGPDATKLTPLSDFFGHFNITDRQGRLFPFRFDAIPVELISSIYEKFVHMADTDGETKLGVHYTPINLVDLALDPVFEGLSPTSRVLDPACGSGVFLVESLRRLVWLQSQETALTRDLIREVLLQQIRGVDISPAALSVAAFSLYLALLELDPAPPHGLDALDCLKFVPLHGRVLYPTSTFDPDLVQKFAASNGGSPMLFDAIVGNPPWTHDPVAKAADAELVKEQRLSGVSSLQEEEEPARRSGVTYARLAGVPLPRRSNDWAFLWRCRDFSHADTRVALVMKATPFFSLEKGAAARRTRLLRTFPNVSMVNLAQLRLSRLFQEYEAEQGAAKAAAGPALLFFSNCLPVDPDSVTVINIPWTPTFQNSGIFELPADPAKGISIDLLDRRPELLKAAAYGEDRDVWFLEKLSRNKRLTTLAAFIANAGLTAGQGFQPGSAYPADHLKGLLQITAKNFRALHIDGDLVPFEALRAYRPYGRERYEGPLVLMPEGGLTVALERGRYAAAFDERDLLYNESFIGISFRGARRDFAHALTAILNSSFVAYQLAFIGCTLGIKQTKVERVDLDNLWIPRLDRLEPDILSQLVEVERDLASAPSDVLLARLDSLVSKACGFHEAEEALLGDAIARARAVIFETSDDRLPMDAAPESHEIKTYAADVCAAFNEFAEEEDDLALAPECYSPAANDLIALRFTLTTKSAAPARQILPAALAEVAPVALSAAFGGPDLPYLKALQSLRLYVGKALIVVKPARYRCFSRAAALSDGDRVLSDIMQSNPDAAGGDAAL